MKKFTAVLLTLCMSYVLVGCDSGSSTPPKKEGGATPTTPAKAPSDTKKP
jgi:hypothetical protein